MKAARSSIPENAQRLEAENGTTISFIVPGDYSYLEGHFPGNPIVPGVAQVGWFLTAMPQCYTSLNYAINRFRFLKPVRPGDCVELTLKRQNTKWLCQVFANGDLASKGLVCIKDDPSHA